jgi:hypothetical protein
VAEPSVVPGVRLKGEQPGEIASRDFFPGCFSLRSFRPDGFIPDAMSCFFLKTTVSGKYRNLHYPPLPSDCMHDIVSSKKMENGIVVFWDEKGEKKYESFNYQELIDMKINALDLLDRPKSYKVDKAAHRLIVKK